MPELEERTVLHHVTPGLPPSPAARRRRLRLLLPALLTIAAMSSPLGAGSAAPADASDAVESPTGSQPTTPTTDHVRFGLR